MPQYFCSVFVSFNKQTLFPKKIILHIIEIIYFCTPLLVNSNKKYILAPNFQPHVFSTL